MRIILTALLILVSAPAVAAGLDPDGYYCSKDAKTWTGPDKVVGPGFNCKLGDPIAGIGTGLAEWKATCTGRPSGIVVMDIGNYNDHIGLSLPASKKWIKLYNCPLHCCDEPK